MSSISSAREPILQTDFLSPECDWQSGRIRWPLSQASGQAYEWTLVACGDWAPGLGHRQATSEDPLGFYGDLLPIMQETDLAMVNLEGVLTDDDLQPIVIDGIAIKLPTSTITGLSIIPFHLACLANNHIFDYGAEGLISTQELLRDHHIQSVGGDFVPKKPKRPEFFSLATPGWQL